MAVVPMTPDDVVAQAKELVGQEVLLTVRGVVTQGESWINVKTSKISAVLVQSFTDEALPWLVDIQPAPLRIEPGELYADEQGVVYVGAGAGMLQAVNGEKRGAMADQSTLKGLRRVKVVDA